jgi:hypothetical protein
VLSINLARLFGGSAAAPSGRVEGAGKVTSDELRRVNGQIEYLARHGRETEKPEAEKETNQ